MSISLSILPSCSSAKSEKPDCQSSIDLPRRKRSSPSASPDRSPVILDVIAARDSGDTDCRLLVEAVVRKSFRTRRRSLLGRCCSPSTVRKLPLASRRAGAGRELDLQRRLHRLSDRPVSCNITNWPRLVAGLFCSHASAPRDQTGCMVGCMVGCEILRVHKHYGVSGAQRAPRIRQAVQGRDQSEVRPCYGDLLAAVCQLDLARKGRLGPYRKNPPAWEKRDGRGLRTLGGKGEQAARWAVTRRAISRIWPTASHASSSTAARPSRNWSSPPGRGDGPSPGSAFFPSLSFTPGVGPARGWDPAPESRKAEQRRATSDVEDTLEAPIWG
jgi:hypothetical protein